MGHQRIAGRVTEQQIGGSNFVRVDVPETNGMQPFSKLFGPSSIYAMTIVDEETAKAMAGRFRVKPLDEWSARLMLNLPNPDEPFDDDITDNY